MAAPDRLQELISQNAVTGIDFVYVHKNQKVLDVFFFTHDDFPQARSILGTISPDQVSIYSPTGGEGLPNVPVVHAAWTVADNRDVLRLTTSVPGGFSTYRLKIDSPKLDRYFNNVPFSFKANCPSDLDCELMEPACPPAEVVDFPIDYKARDFWSYRRALLDFVSLRYPDWKDRLEADVGVMLLEVMSALGDELAYYQDRIAREAYLETASQRRSRRHHARLVDYDVHNGRASTAWLDVTVKAAEAGIHKLKAGADVWALSDEGRRISFEVGRGLNDQVLRLTFDVAASRNALDPHIWDEDDVCLPVGTTELFLDGKRKADLVFDDPPGDPSGKWVLLKTEPEAPSKPRRRWLVRVVEVEETKDDVFNKEITRIAWDKSQALPFELNLKELKVRCNLVPVTAGRTVVNRFTIGVDPASLQLPAAAEPGLLRRAVEREGAGGSTTYLFSLTGPGLKPEDRDREEAEAFLAGLDKPEGKDLTWLGPTPQTAQPEMRLAEVDFTGTNWVETGLVWEWRRSLQGVSSSMPSDQHFTLEDGTWDRVVGYWRSGQEVVHEDYASGEGFTIRFGDSEFGKIPPQNARFQVTYRLGNGTATNVAPDTITKFDETYGFIEAVTNPLPADGGRDAQTPQEVRLLAPEAFRSCTYRAVRPEDYAEAAERLPWVDRAGAESRWTGSWLTIFATPDPAGAVTLTREQRSELGRQLDRFRQAGREAYVRDPRYADLDLDIRICVEPSAYKGDVREAVLQVLLGTNQTGAEPGFFSADNFTFGTPLERSALEGVVQSVEGVRAVMGILIRRRGWFDWRLFSGLTFKVATNEVIRVENNPIFPARGSVRLTMVGGA